MGKVRIITDTSADLPQHLIEKYDITVVPIKLFIDGETYIPGQSITAEEFYRKLETCSEIPSTSQPTPLDYCEAFRKNAEEDTELLCITLSSNLSGTYQSAVLGSRMVEEEDGIKVEVMDSKTVAYGLGLAVVAAARAAQAGKSLEECKEIALHYTQNQRIYFLVDTLEYLQKGGRIGKAAAVVGSLLNIKPILSISEDGEVYVVEKVRGKNKATNRIFDLAKEFVNEGQAVSVSILHSATDVEANQWLDRVKSDPYFDVKEDYISQLGPIIGTHAGPGTMILLIAQYKA